ncbi:single-stranded DNA-binding protein [Haloferula sp.]|uniref:single-stranded DNA-binding protein n=1 Tax=Haloferula sp. TaxID=2497595 RepID=UPI003C730BB2
MANLNKVLLIGNLTKDPEVRYTPKGTAVGDLGLAVNRRVKDSNDNWTDETTFVDITVWGNTAENAQKYLTKGRGVFVEGRLQLDTWDDRETGKKRSKLKIVAEVLQFLPDGKGGGGRPAGGGGASQSSTPSQSAPQGGSAAEPSDFDGEEDDIPF